MVQHKLKLFYYHFYYTLYKLIIRQLEHITGLLKRNLLFLLLEFLCVDQKLVLSWLFVQLFLVGFLQVLSYTFQLYREEIFDAESPYSVFTIWAVWPHCYWSMNDRFGWARKQVRLAQISHLNFLFLSFFLFSQHPTCMRLQKAFCTIHHYYYSYHQSCVDRKGP